MNGRQFSMSMPASFALTALPKPTPAETIPVSRSVKDKTGLRLYAPAVETRGGTLAFPHPGRRKKTFRRLEQYAHEIAGGTIMACGAAILCGL